MKSKFLNEIVITEKQKNPTKVPKIPKVIMFFIFAKKFPRYILKPDAKTIGGKHM
jgi:hypothetical protein